MPSKPIFHSSQPLDPFPYILPATTAWAAHFEKSCKALKRHRTVLRTLKAVLNNKSEFVVVLRSKGLRQPSSHFAVNRKLNVLNILSINLYYFYTISHRHRSLDIDLLFVSISPFMRRLLHADPLHDNKITTDGDDIVKTKTKSLAVFSSQINTREQYGLFER